MRDQLEQALRDEDLETLAVCADWLESQADPRGAFMLAQLALEAADLTEARREALIAEERRLLADNAAAWLGAGLAGAALAEPPKWGLGTQVSLRYGFLHAIETDELEEPLVEAILACPDRAHARRLVLAHFEEGLVGQLGAVDWPNLQTLVVGLPDDRSSGFEPDLQVLLPKTPRLRALHIGARDVDVGAVFGADLPQLRELTVNHEYEYPLERLATNPAMANLEALTLFPHALEPEDEQAYLRLEHVQAVAASEHLRGLRRLTLNACSAGDAGVDAMIEHGLIDRLEELNLMYGQVSDAGARRLAAHPATAALKRLVLTGNRLTPEGQEALTSAGVEAVFGEMFDPEDTEREYLWYGDME